MTRIPSISSSHLQRAATLLGLGLAFLGLMLSAGCFSIPKPSYLKVDHDTPEFKKAVAGEVERQKAQGVSAAKAEKNAEEIVSRQVIQSEKDRRSEQVVPLVQALTAFDLPRGCWAYTTTTTARHDSGTATVIVETYDASQPEARLWTLVSRDGKPPDEKEQADYRVGKLRAWKRQTKEIPAKYSPANMAKLGAVWREMEVAPAAADGQTTFTFTNDPGHIAIVGDIASFREIYTIDTTKRAVVEHTETLLSPASALGGSFKMNEFTFTSDYALIDPEAPPFPVRSTSRARGSFFGKDTGLMEAEVVYTDYRRVKCYDEQFQVQIGEPTMTGFMP